MVNKEVLGFWGGGWGFKSIRAGLNKHGSSFRDIHFVANDTIKFNNAINFCLINLNIILYYSFLLNTHEH